MNQLSLRTYWLKFETSGKSPTILEESVECILDEFRKPQKMSTCNRLDLETLGSWPIMPKNHPWTLVLPCVLLLQTRRPKAEKPLFPYPQIEVCNSPWPGQMDVFQGTWSWCAHSQFWLLSQIGNRLIQLSIANLELMLRYVIWVSFNSCS